MRSSRGPQAEAASPHVQEQVAGHHLLQGRLERLDQLVWQPRDKAHRVDQEALAALCCSTRPRTTSEPTHPERSTGLHSPTHRGRAARAPWTWCRGSRKACPSPTRRASWSGGSAASSCPRSCTQAAPRSAALGASAARHGAAAPLRKKQTARPRCITRVQPPYHTCTPHIPSHDPVRHTRTHLPAASARR
jgi:hypothetical protein